MKGKYGQILQLENAWRDPIIHYFQGKSVKDKTLMR